MSPPPRLPAGDSFTLSSKARRFRVYTAIFAFVYFPMQLNRSLTYSLMTVCPLFASGSLCLIMTANAVRRSQASKPAVYWTVVAEDLAIGAGNIGIAVLLLVVGRFRFANFPGQLIVGRASPLTAHVGFALKAVMDWLDARRAQETTGCHNHHPAMSTVGGVSPGNGDCAASQADVQVSPSHPDTRDEAQTASDEGRRLVDA